MNNLLEKGVTSFAEEIEELIKDNKETYKQARRITSDFRLEKETTKAYNGRQILELLQNADDSKTDKVEIYFNREKNILSISNNGEEFSVDQGIASLMIANTSSKKKEFIGNKGLGFRSILNWVSTVKIKTKTDIVVFSKEIAKRNFQSLALVDQESLLKNNEDRLDKNEVPFAVLAIPELYQNNNGQHFVTTIELEYLERVEAKIEEQLSILKPEILLFLNHIKEINIIDSNNVLTKTITNTSNDSESIITINDSVWNIEDSGDVYYKTVNDKEQFYQYKIAWKDDLSDHDSRFFSFFPTQVSTHLPFLIHATFELDPARNYLNNSSENKDILLAIAGTIENIALNDIRKEKSDWMAYRFLSVDGVSDNKLLKDFYVEITKKKTSLAILPCVDGKYRNISEVLYFGNHFSQFIIDNNLQSHFKNLLLPIPQDIEVEHPENKYDFDNNLSVENFYDKIQYISYEITESKIRAELIYHLSQYDFNKFHHQNYPLLINKDNKHIKSDTIAFTPASSENIESPSFLNIDIINNELYQNLIFLFKDGFDANEQKSRELQRKIKFIVNIQPYDISNITKRIISGTRDQLKEIADKDDKAKIIVEMVQVLYKNRQININQESLNDIIPLLNKKGQVVNNEDLFLGKDYPTGELTSELFEGIYTNNDFLAGNEIWEFESPDSKEEFFIWLGVNRFGKIKKISKSLDRYEDDDEYVRFVFENSRKPENESHKYYSVTTISNFDKIIDHEEFGLEKLIVWIAKDKLFSAQLEDDNEDIFYYTYNRNRTDVISKPSFIKYQLSQKNLFNNIIVDNDFKELSNEDFDFNHDIFQKYAIEENQIKSLLIKLGAKISFLDAEPEFVYKILNGTANSEKYIDGKGSQQAYKKIHDYFSKNKNSKLLNFTPNFDGMAYYARLGGKGQDYKLIPFDEVYYSDNQLLPENILKDYWIINLPKRVGEDNVKRFFGINLIQDELRNLEVVNRTVSEFDHQFKNYINKLKPYFLTHRFIAAMEEKSKRIEANKIKKLKISLVSDLSFKFKNRDIKQLEDNGFLEVDHVFYIKSGIISRIDDLRNSPEFCDAIAEILSIAFKVTDLKNAFRTVFKDSIEESKHLIAVDDLSHEYADAKRLLGIPMEEINFWTSIFKSIGKKFPEVIGSYEELGEILHVNLGYSLPENYRSIDFQNFKDETSVIFLKDITQIFDITLEDLLSKNSKGLFAYHNMSLKNKLYDLKTSFNNALWIQLNDNKDKQRFLITKQEKFDNLLSSEFIPKIVHANRYEFIDDYGGFLKPIIEEQFNIELTNVSEKNIVIIDAYVKILKDFNVEENDIEDPNKRSLLYFENNDETVYEMVKEISTIEGEKDKEVENNHSTGTLHFNSSTSKLLKRRKSKAGSNRKSTVSDNHGRKNKRAGKKAELLVYNSLMDDDSIGEVQWVSGYSNTSDKSDNEHYDMRYKLKDDNIWKYLEVKAFNGQYFHFSISEKEKAIEEAENYQIALVDGEDIFILKDLFTEDIDFEKNEKFSATPADYIVSLKIEN